MFATALQFLITPVTFAMKTIHENGLAKNGIVAHRGAFKTNKLPENSIASLKNAIALKCAGSEFDVQMTADDSLIINHDPKYNGLTIEKTAYAELKKHLYQTGSTYPHYRNIFQQG